MASHNQQFSLPPSAATTLGATRWHLSSAARSSGELIELHFKLRDGSRRTVSVPVGTNLLEAAHLNEIELEGACEASLACSTCHVILSQEVYDLAGEPSEKEEDLLDLAPCLTSTSRLACQVIVDKSLKGAEIALPQLTVNFYVDGFVPTPH
jgi:ferredoxin